MEEQLYDVVIYEIKTRKIESIVGNQMLLDQGFYNAEKRLETVLTRINDRFYAKIVETGKYKKGDIL